MSEVRAGLAGDPETRDEHGRTALMQAACAGDGDRVAQLLAAGADPGAADSHGQTPLMAAAFHGLLETMGLLIRHGAPVAARDERGRTALLLAAEAGHSQMVRALVAHGADVDAGDGQGETPLLRAAALGKQDVVEVLLAAGADPDARSDDGRAALLEAVREDQQEIVPLLLGHRAAVDIQGPGGETPLMVAVVQGQLTLARVLLEHGADVNARDAEGRTPLQTALEHGRVRSAALLGSMGGRVADAPGSPVTPLMGAAAAGDPGEVRRLLATGADADAPGPEGMTALMFAAEQGHAEVARVLLAAGACLDSRLTSGATALSLAATRGQAACIRALSGAGGTSQALRLAAANGHAPAVSALLRAGADVDGSDRFGVTPLMLAAEYGREQVVWTLLAAAADPHRADRGGETAADRAKSSGQWSVVSGQSPKAERQTPNAAPTPNAQRPTPSLVIRADGGLQDGIGHVMRCLALARGWLAAGGRVVFLAHCEGETVPRWIRDSGVEYVPLSAPHPDPVDLEATLAQLRRLREEDPGGGQSWVVIDGYHFDSDYELALRDAGFRVLTVDDHAHRYAVCADALLNQGLAAQDFYYRCSPDALLLIGPRYSLLRPEFLAWHGWDRPIPRQARKVLVTLGGTDADNVTQVVIEAIRLLGREDLEIRVVVGPTSPHVRSLLQAAREAPGRFRLLTAVTDMPRLMAWADVAVAAGGITSWELAYMGVPSIILILARNQIRNAEAVEAAGAGLNGGWHHRLDPRTLAERMAPILTSRSIRARMSRCGRRLVDGKGVQRVMARLRLLDEDD